MDRFKLFVYGTLMRGGVRHRVLADQRFLGEAQTRPCYVLLHLGDYPGLIHCAEKGRAIHGELYEVVDSLRKQLDALEGAPHLFRLEPVLLQRPEGEVEAYFFQPDSTGLSLYGDDRWRNSGAQP
jgi:gamma-glutamylcyclotransferase (GGCT)/AIG2-like uncharacterized protein YtfP